MASGVARRRFEYPPVPHRSRYFDLIANEHSIIYVGQVEYYGTVEGVSGANLHIFCRYRNRWLQPIPIPYKYDKETEDVTQLLGFVNRRCIRILITEFTDAERLGCLTYVVTVHFSETFDAVVSTNTVRVTPDKLELHFWHPLKHTAEEVLLLSHSWDTLVLNIYKVRQSSATIIAQLERTGRCLFATEFDGDIYTLNAALGQAHIAFLRRYNLERGELTTVTAYDSCYFSNAKTYWPTDIHAFRHRNWLFTFLTKGSVFFFVFDLTAQRQLFAKRNFYSELHTFRIADTGEAFLYECFGKTLKWKCWQPRTLADIALRTIHCAMPRFTHARLQLTGVDSSVKLVDFLHRPCAPILPDVPDTRMDADTRQLLVKVIVCIIAVLLMIIYG